MATKLQSDNDKITLSCGTSSYIAPEVLDKKYHGYSYEVDRWSLGIIIYLLLIGKTPFEVNNENETYNKILFGKYTFPRNTHISKEAKDLIQKMLVSNPKERLNLNSILNHKFLALNTLPKRISISSLDRRLSLESIQQKNKENEINKYILEKEIEKIKNELSKEKKMSQQSQQEIEELQKQLKKEKNVSELSSQREKILENELIKKKLFQNNQIKKWKN